MGTKFLRSLFAGFASIALVLGFAAPAQADWSDCASGRLCIWTGYSSAGTISSWTLGHIKTLPNDCLVLSGSQNNSASSLYLNATPTSSNVVLYSNPTGASATWWLSSAGYIDTDFRGDPGITGFDNTLSKICVVAV